MPLQAANFGLKVFAAKMIGHASRLSGRGGGTTLPGRALLRMDPDALLKLGRRLQGPITVVSATNGKTTTSSLLAGMLRAAGRRPVHNRAGSNMSWGVTTALVAQSGNEGLFEVDEAWLPEVAETLEPDVFVLGNLFRDQLDRHGELETLSSAWRQMVLAQARRTEPVRAGSTGVASFIINADDPRLAALGRDERGRELANVLYFGIDDPSHPDSGAGFADDAPSCPRCGGDYSYDLRLIGHLGHYRCENCGFSRPEPHFSATRIEPRGMDGSQIEVTTPVGQFTVELTLPGLYNVHNALAALTAAFALGVPMETATGALAKSEAAFGRTERIQLGGKEAAFLLIKNPTGATEVIRTLADTAIEEARGLDLWIALNDGIADGRDISWIWDADFDQLAGRVRSVTCSGSRAEEMALRLQYAGWARERITVNRDLTSSFDSAIAEAEDTLYALPTYTALLQLRSHLAERGDVANYLA